jgi:hypothetical protein
MLALYGKKYHYFAVLYSDFFLICFDSYVYFMKRILAFHELSGSSLFSFTIRRSVFPVSIRDIFRYNEFP